MIEPTPEDREQLIKTIRELKEDKHCSYCVHATNEPHYEHGKYAGTDVYCNILNELRCGYPTGEQCLHWEEKACHEYDR